MRRRCINRSKVLRIIQLTVIYTVISNDRKSEPRSDRISQHHRLMMRSISSTMSMNNNPRYEKLFNKFFPRIGAERAYDPKTAMQYAVKLHNKIKEMRNNG